MTTNPLLNFFNTNILKKNMLSLYNQAPLSQTDISSNNEPISPSSDSSGETLQSLSNKLNNERKRLSQRDSYLQENMFENIKEIEALKETIFEIQEKNDELELIYRNDTELLVMENAALLVELERFTIEKVEECSQTENTTSDPSIDFVETVKTEILSFYTQTEHNSNEFGTQSEPKEVVSIGTQSVRPSENPVSCQTQTDTTSADTNLMDKEPNFKVMFAYNSMVNQVELPQKSILQFYYVSIIFISLFSEYQIVSLISLIALGSTLIY
jgi:hypothetical protein